MEPRYAEIVRVMFVKGEWLVPTVNGDLYTDKPILYFWLVLIGSTLAGGVSEWTVRFPCALAALGLVLTTYAFGRDFFRPRTGFIAGAVLATSTRVVWEARWAHTDMVYSFFFTLSLYYFARSIFRKGGPNEILWAYVFMGLATLTKGLIGVVLPGLILVSFLAVQRDWGLTRTWRVPWGVLIFLGVAAPWFAWVSVATDGKWLGDFIYVHHFKRYTSGFGHREPFYYYLTTLPRDFLPWTVFAVPALFAYRPRASLSREPVPLFFILWFVAIFLFFSASDTKRDLYLLPAMPAAALFVGRYIDDLTETALAQGPLYRGLSLLFFNLLWIGGAASPVIAWYVRREAVWLSVPAAVVMVAGGLAAVCFIRRRLPWNLFLTTVGIMVLVGLCASLWILPDVNRYKSPRPFSLEIKKRVAPTEPLYIYADTMNDFNYYLERDRIPIVTSKGELDELATQGQTGYLLVREKDLRRRKLGVEDRIVVTAAVGSETWHLVSLGGG